MAELALVALATGGGAAAAGATTATIIGAGLTAATAFGQIQAGRAAGQSASIQARQAGVNAKLAELEGRQTSLKIKEDLNRTLASQSAIFAARGVVRSEGSALAAQEASREQANRDIRSAQFGADIEKQNARQRASLLRSEGRAARTTGLVQAAGTVGTFAQNNSSMFGGSDAA